LKNQNIKETQSKEKPFDFVLFITVLILLAMGIVMVLSASSPSALAESGNSYSYVTRQAIFAVIGIAIMLIISKIDYKIYSKFANIAYIGSIIILAVVPIIGSASKGATRWLDLGFIRFQPSEIAKIALIIFYATWLTKNKDNLKNFKNGFIKPLLYIVPIAIILIIFQDHLSVTIIIIAVISIMMIMAGTKLKYFITIGSIGAVGVAGALFALAKFTEKGGFRISRITTFLNPWSDIQGDGWQIIQSLYAIGSGRIIWSRTRRKQAKIFIHTRTTQRFYIFSTCRRIRIYWLYSCYYIICNIYLERIFSGNACKRHVCKFSSSRNYIINRITSNNEYSSCNIINAKYRYTITIFQLWRNRTCNTIMFSRNIIKHIKVM